MPNKYPPSINLNLTFEKVPAAVEFGEAFYITLQVENCGEAPISRVNLSLTARAGEQTVADISPMVTGLGVGDYVDLVDGVNTSLLRPGPQEIVLSATATVSVGEGYLSFDAPEARVKIQYAPKMTVAIENKPTFVTIGHRFNYELLLTNTGHIPLTEVKLLGSDGRIPLENDHLSLKEHRRLCVTGRRVTLRDFPELCLEVKADSRQTTTPVATSAQISVRPPGWVWASLLLGSLFTIALLGLLMIDPPVQCTFIDETKCHNAAAVPTEFDGTREVEVTREVVVTSLVTKTVVVTEIVTATVIPNLSIALPMINFDHFSVGPAVNSDVQSDEESVGSTIPLSLTVSANTQIARWEWHLSPELAEGGWGEPLKSETTGTTVEFNIPEPADGRCPNYKVEITAKRDGATAALLTHTRIINLCVSGDQNG